MTMSWSQWVDSVNGQAVDPGPWGAQCYGLLQNYFNNVIGGQGQPSTQIGPDPGYAIDVYDGYDSNGMSQYFQKLGPDATPQQGDVAFWDWGSPIAPKSHVAVVNANAGSDLNVYSQNSPQAYTTLQNLPKEGLAGYLRPTTPVQGVSPSSTADFNPFDPFNMLGNIGNAGGQIANSPLNPAQGIGGAVLGLQYIADFFNRIDQFMFNGGVVKFLTTLMLPSTWIRIQAAFVGFILFVLGIVLIVVDYSKNKGIEIGKELI